MSRESKPRRNLPCPTCGSMMSNVVDTRPKYDYVRRRRQCENGHRFTTREYVYGLGQRRDSAPFGWGTDAAKAISEKLLGVGEASPARDSRRGNAFGVMAVACFVSVIWLTVGLAVGSKITRANLERDDPVRVTLRQCMVSVGRAQRVLDSVNSWIGQKPTIPLLLETEPQ